MKFQIISDIHLEFDKGCVDYNWPKIEVLSPLLCLLGDIGFPNEPFYEQFLLQQADKFENVIVITGNHEYYTQTSIFDTNKNIEEICSKRDNLHFLNNEMIELDDFIFAGTTLWSNIAKQKQLISFGCNDYNHIRITANDGDGTRKISVDDTNQFHKTCVNFIEDKVIPAAGNKNKKVIILSHHAPTQKNVLEESERGSGMEEMTCTNLEYLMHDSPIHCWCFGHSHYSSDQVIGNTRVVSNQHGYCSTNYNKITKEYQFFDEQYEENNVIDTNEPFEKIITARKGWYEEPQENSTTVDETEPTKTKDDCKLM